MLMTVFSLKPARTSFTTAAFVSDASRSCSQTRALAKGYLPPKLVRPFCARCHYFEMVVPSEVILPLIAVPKAVNAPTTAIATNAAATAYYDNSRPVSSRKNLLIILFAPLVWLVLVPRPTLKSWRVVLKVNSHDVRATPDCGPLRLLLTGESVLAVRRPKPLIPLRTAPHRVSASSRNPFPEATNAPAPDTTASANTKAATAITACDTNSFTMNCFMRFQPAYFIREL